MSCQLIISAAGTGGNRALQFVTCHVLPHLVTVSQGGEMNTSKLRDLLISNISIAESISKFLFKGDFGSVATALSWSPPTPFQLHSLWFTWVLESQCNPKARKRGPSKGRRQELLLQKGLLTCFPFAMSRLAFQQLCPESQVQTSFGLQVNL